LQVPDRRATPGGLSVGLEAALQSSGGLWFGWSGKTGETQPKPSVTRVGHVDYATIDLSRQDVAEYYNGFSNRVLWPTLHYRLDRVAYERRFRDGYLRVNDRMSRALLPMLRPDDLVWIHDYHLIPLARFLRGLGARQPLGFFLHIPFPPAEIVIAMPEHADILEGLLHYDLVGFQTEQDRDCFMETATRALGAERAGRNRLRYHGRIVRAEAVPIGIDTDNLERWSRQAAATRSVQNVRDSVVDSAIIIGVDRLDYSKGIPQRFTAFDQFLRHYYGRNTRATLLQISPPSRTDVPDYQALHDEVTSLAGQINARHSEPDWVAIRHIYKSFSRRALAGLFRSAKVGLVTPLRDGMNLVAKEYVAAQDPEDPGVLVLSRFAGAANTLDGALLVNPYNIPEMADLIYRALTMPRQERRDRWSGMIGCLRRNTAADWGRRFLDLLRAARAANET